MAKVTALLDNEHLERLDAAHQAIEEYKPLINTYVIPAMSDNEEDESTVEP